MSVALLTEQGEGRGPPPHRSAASRRRRSTSSSARTRCSPRTCAFRSLGVVVIDEQHRFGVEQRAALREKGPPDEARRRGPRRARHDRDADPEDRGDGPVRRPRHHGARRAAHGSRAVETRWARGELGKRRPSAACAPRWPRATGPSSSARSSTGPSASRRASADARSTSGSRDGPLRACASGSCTASSSPRRRSRSWTRFRTGTTRRARRDDGHRGRRRRPRRDGHGHPRRAPLRHRPAAPAARPRRSQHARVVVLPARRADDRRRAARLEAVAAIDRRLRARRGATSSCAARGRSSARASRVEATCDSRSSARDRDDLELRAARRRGAPRTPTPSSRRTTSCARSSRCSSTTTRRPGCSRADRASPYAAAVRVVAGEARGRRLDAKLPAHVRPTTDLVREAVFSVLAARFDLRRRDRVPTCTAAAGRWGSRRSARGAASCTFVDADPGVPRRGAPQPRLGRASASATAEVRARPAARSDARRRRSTSCAATLPTASSTSRALLEGLVASVVVVESDRALDGADRAGKRRSRDATAVRS